MFGVATSVSIQHSAGSRALGLSVWVSGVTMWLGGLSGVLCGEITTGACGGVYTVRALILVDAVVVAVVDAIVVGEVILWLGA